MGSKASAAFRGRFVLNLYRWTEMGRPGSTGTTRCLVCIFTFGVGAAALAESGSVAGHHLFVDSTETSHGFRFDGDTTSLIVKLISGLSASDQDAAITRHGGHRDERGRPPATARRPGPGCRCRRDPRGLPQRPAGQRAELDKTRQAEADPLRPRLRLAVGAAEDRLGHRLRRAALPRGSATIAVLDTGVSSADGDLDRR